MKVKELIEQLQRCHQDDKVRVSLHDGGYGNFGGVIEVNEITETRLGYVTLIADTGEI